MRKVLFLLLFISGVAHSQSISILRKSGVDKVVVQADSTNFYNAIRSTQYFRMDSIGIPAIPSYASSHLVPRGMLGLFLQYPDGSLRNLDSSAAGGAGETNLLGDMPGTGVGLAGTKTGVTLRVNRLYGTSPIIIADSTDSVRVIADTTVLATRSAVLKNADSTSIRNYSNSLYLKNADSTTQRTYSNSLYQPTITGSGTSIDTETLTADAVVITDGSGKLAADPLTSAAELHYVDGVTSAIQTQMNLKAPLASPPITGNATFDSLTVSSDVIIGRGNAAQIIIDGTDGAEYAGLGSLYEKSGTLSLSSPADMFFGIDNDASAADGNDDFKWIRNAGGPLAAADSVIMTLSDQGRLGLGKGRVTPLSALDMVVAAPDTEAVNITLASKNITRTSVAQMRDTSAVNFRFTNTGKPLFNMTGITGNSIVAVDSTGNVAIGGLTASTALYSDANKVVTSLASVSNTELGYLDGVTSAIQTQMDLKAPLASPSFTGTVSNSGGYTQSGTSANTFTGTSTFSNATYSALFTGGNVGIGTTTPSVKLEVRGAAASNPSIKLGTVTANKFMSIDYTEDGTNAYGGFVMGTASTEAWTFWNREHGSTLGFKMRNNGGSYHSMTLYHNDADGVITTTGGDIALMPAVNVGIGTTGPTTKLHAYGADNTTVSTVEIAATQANVTTADVFMDFRSSSGSEATIAGTAVAGVIAYNTFTGAHYSQKENDIEPMVEGMLVSATGNFLPGETKYLPTITRTQGRNDKRVYGVFSGKIADGATQSLVDSVKEFRRLKNFADSLYTTENHNDSISAGNLLAVAETYRDVLTRLKGTSANYGKGNPRKDLYQVFALGTGIILVTESGGNIAVGDFIASSPTRGLGEKQADDIEHSYTVAKANEGVDWSLVTVHPQLGVKVKRIACTYTN